MIGAHVPRGDVTGIDSSEDMITFSNATLHWVHDHISVLKGVKEGLKRSGRILFQMGGRGNAQDMIDTVDTVIRTQPWSLFFRSFSFPYTFCSPEDNER